MQHPYSTPTLFIEKLNYYKHDNVLNCIECNCPANACDMLTDKYDHNYCIKCASLMTLTKRNSLKTRYYALLNEEQFTNMVNDFIIVFANFQRLRKDNACLRMNINNVIAQLLIKNNYATYEQTKDYRLWFQSIDKNNYYNHVWTKISI